MRHGEALAAFLAGGYTPRSALEVVLGIGAYTMSTLANRLTRAPLDPQLSQFALCQGARQPTGAGSGLD